MSAKLLIWGGIAAAALAALGIKGASLYNKAAQALGMINFNFSFVRIHGLVGEEITKFTNPTIRVVFNLNLKNFTGFNIDVQKIYCRIETKKEGTKDWSVIALPSGYFNIKLADGGELNKPLYFDFKGVGTITSLINKANRHRVVITAELKGQRLPEYTTDLDLTGPISKFWDLAQKVNTIKQKVGLKGIDELAN